MDISPARDAQECSECASLELVYMLHTTFEDPNLGSCNRTKPQMRD